MPIIKKECLPSGTNYINGTVVKVKKKHLQIYKLKFIDNIIRQFIKFCGSKGTKT